jgi:hypothetical protein
VKHQDQRKDLLVGQIKDAFWRVDGVIVFRMHDASLSIEAFRGASTLKLLAHVVDCLASQSVAERFEAKAHT